MQFINPIYLITYGNNDTDDIGNTITVPIKRKVFADISSIKQSEFYQAQANGLKPEITLKIRTFEYKGEKKVEYNGTKYNVLKTYTNNFGTMELTCEKVIGNK